MVKHGQHWSCRVCLASTDKLPDLAAGNTLKVLNLYAGIGGNRYLWPDTVAVTAVEKDARVAAAYKRLFPRDTVIVADAHAYLVKNFFKYNFIWSSPPCQSHTRLNYSLPNEKKKYLDLGLWQEIIFLKYFFKGGYVVENVKPYYNSFVEPTFTIGRHCFWSNFNLTDHYVSVPECMIDWRTEGNGSQIKEWLGFSIPENIRLNGNNPLQIYRNCVHPKIGLSVFNDFLATIGNK